MTTRATFLIAGALICLVGIQLEKTDYFGGNSDDVGLILVVYGLILHFAGLILFLVRTKVFGFLRSVFKDGYF